jgi:diguanylate cyclase (GGDEF)-like protein
MAVDINKHLERAKRFLERSRFEDAIESYQAILSESPGHVEALQALGDTYTRMGKPDRAAIHYAVLFERLFDGCEENKALAIYSRALKGIQQPPERMARYALLLQKQNRVEEAIEQFALASELFLARGREEGALECLERVAQLDPDDAGRQSSLGELAERLGKAPLAARAFLRAGQLAEAGGDAESALELLDRARQLVPTERSPALLYGQALLRRGRMREAADVLEPFAADQTDPAFLSTLGDALMLTGALDRARELFERLPSDKADTAGKLFALAGRYLDAGQDAPAVDVLRKVQQQMMAARRETEFATQVDFLVASHPASIPLAEFWAAAYAEMNRETKYFDALARLFDLYLDAGDVAGACDAFEKLVEIDPYDSRNQQRVEKLEQRADAGFLERIRKRLSQVATHASQSAAPAPVQTRPAAGEANAAPQALEDLLVQAEIFIQYSLQAKAVERLQTIFELFPQEAEHNERLRNLCQLASWWPPSADADRSAAAGAPKAAPDSADTMRDLTAISAISQALLRLSSPRAILSAAINEIGGYLRATRCLAVIGAPGKPPQMASEFCASGIEPAPGALLVRLLAQLDRAAPDTLGGLSLDAGAAPVLREIGLETVLGVVLTDRETQTQAGMVIVGFAASHVWRPNETYFLQAVGDQMLLGVNHARHRTLERALNAADQGTALLARSSYQDCLLNETRHAQAQGLALSIALLQFDRGRELLRQHGEVQLENHLEQVARALESVVRQTDLEVKYTSWAIAFILPDTALAGARMLADKLRQVGVQLAPPWGGEPLTLSVSIAEAVARPGYDSEDIVTELINRAEAGLEEATHRGGDALVTPKILGS